MNVEVIRARAAYHKRNARGTFAASDEHSGNLFDLAANEIESLTAERDRLKVALEAFASDKAWRRDGICDPNSSHFQGQFIAEMALGKRDKGAN